MLGEYKYRSLLVETVSIENRIDKKKRPLFLLHCKNDKVVPYKNSILTHKAFVRYQKNQRPAYLRKGRAWVWYAGLKH